MGACRRTRAARASRSRPPRKRSTSSPSVAPPPPGPGSARRCWMTVLIGLVGIGSSLAPAVVSASFSSQRAVLIHEFPGRANGIAPALIAEMVTAKPRASPDLIPAGRFGTPEKNRRDGGVARGERLRHRAGRQRQRRLVHELKD